MGTWYVCGLPYSSDELYHHGIKGQKWGVRRFQNPDGSYTEAGKERYGRNIRRDLDSFQKVRADLRSSESEYVKTIGKPDHKQRKEQYENDIKRYSEIMEKIAKKYGDKEYKKRLDKYVHQDDEIRSFMSNEKLMRKFGYDPDHGIDKASETYYKAEEKYLKSIGTDPHKYYNNINSIANDFENYSWDFAEKLFRNSNANVDDIRRQDLAFIFREYGYDERLKRIPD